MKIKEFIKDKERVEKFCESQINCNNCPLLVVYSHISLIGDNTEPKFCIYNKQEIIDPKYLEKEIDVKVDILDEAEKRYLRGVIRPFRNRITAIKKGGGDTYEYITIYVIEIDTRQTKNKIYLPYFKKDSMYKRMEQGKKYTLEELGL